MAEQVLRWATPVIPDRLSALCDCLNVIGKSPEENEYLPFSSLPMLHFASLTLFDEGEYDRTEGVHGWILVFESNIDRPLKVYLDQLVLHGRKGLDAIYGCCEHYPGPSATNAEVVLYLRGLNRRAQLYHVGHPNRSVQEIKGDHELRRSIVHHLDGDATLRGRSPREIVRKIRSLANCPRSVWPLWRPWHPTWDGRSVEPPTPLGDIQWLSDRLPWQRLARFVMLAFIGWAVGTSVVMLATVLGVPRIATLTLEALGVLLLIRQGAPHAPLLRGAGVAAGAVLPIAATFYFWPLLTRPPLGLTLVALAIVAPVAFLLVSYVIVWRGTCAPTLEFPILDEQDRARLRMLLEAEERQAYSPHNHVAGLTVLKERFRWVRWVRVWLVMFLLNLFYRTQFVKGKLATIPTIHFAQWSLVSDRFLLFVTNYDGATDRYLDDFFDSLALGVAFIWYGTTIFPRTLDPRHLKVWVRQGQTLASVRYRAAVYDGLTVGAINDNTWIRKRLLRGRGRADARRWLRRLATTPEEPDWFPRLLERFRGLFGAAE